MYEAPSGAYNPVGDKASVGELDRITNFLLYMGTDRGKEGGSDSGSAEI